MPAPFRWPQWLCPIKYGINALAYEEFHAHVDPTAAYHDRMHLTTGTDLDADVIEIWPIDLRGW